jgi:Cd2+/Zn2+-exporting ATPase
VDCVAFDKTGTLTEGRPRLVETMPLDGMSVRDVHRIAAALEDRSAHPLAEAVVAAWHESGGGALPEVTDFEHLAGRGVAGTLEGVRYRLGRPTLFGAGEIDERVSAAADQGRTVSLLGTDEAGVMAMLSFADVPREAAGAAIGGLRAAGISGVAMLTGDNERTAAAVARAVGIDEFHAGLLPEEKVEAVERLKADHGRVAMVGDGVNDAPALAAADVGIAMGAAGSDTALETCDVALMSDDLARLPYALRLSRRAGRVIRQNITVSLLLKFTLALGVIPGYVSLITAVLVGDMGASLAVTLNAMRLARTRH